MLWYEIVLPWPSVKVLQGVCVEQNCLIYPEYFHQTMSLQVNNISVFVLLLIMSIE
jgi:hypothetical protein